MPGPARAGALIYADDVERIGRFYQEVFVMKALVANAERHVVEGDLQLVIHARSPSSSSMATAVSAAPREQTLKLFFTVASLASATALIESLGGLVFGPTYDGPGFTVRNASDPEGNIFHLRATAP